MELKDLKEVANELEFSLESIKRESSQLLEVKNSIASEIDRLKEYSSALGTPIVAIQKLIDNINALQSNIDGAVDSNKLELGKAVLALQEIVQTFEDRAGGVIDKIDFSSLENQLAARMDQSFENVLSSQKQHLETLKKVVVSLNAASDKVNKDGQRAAELVSNSNSALLRSIKDFNDQVKSFSMVTIIPWAIASFVVGSAMAYEITKYATNNQVSQLQSEASFFSSRALPDQYYFVQNNKTYMKIPLNDRTRNITKTRDTVFVELH